MALVVKYLAEKYQGKLRVGKLNLDDNEMIPKKYGAVEKIAMLLFKNGERMYQILGVVDMETLEEQVVALL